VSAVQRVECRQLSVADNCEGFYDMTIKALSDTHKRTNQYLIRQSVSGHAADDVLDVVARHQSAIISAT
jgi:hypothetical protein